MSSPAPPRPTPWRRLAALAGLYTLVTLLTRPYFLGDTIDYASDALRFDRHGWEFGHLWWVPLGWSLRSLTGIADRPGVVRLFLVINWLAGLACVLLLRSLLARAGVGSRPALAATVAFLFSHAFLDYTQTGSSYVPGLACLLAAFVLAVPPADPGPSSRLWPRAAGAGLALAAAVSFWFPYVLAVPGVLLAPCLLESFTRRRLGFAAGIAIAFVVFAGLAYTAALWSLGLGDLAGIRAWAARSSHGVTTRGAARMVFGLARSFLWMGEDGVLFKRFLLHDPYNPVSLADLVRLSLWKFLFFYLTLAAVALGLLAGGRRGRRLLLLAGTGSAPVIVFGVFWQGGDLERYFPLYPLFFLALGTALAPACGWQATRALLLGFCAVVVLVNGFALSVWRVNAYQQHLTDRVHPLLERLPPGSRLFVVRDRLHLLPRDFPLEPATSELVIVEAVVPGTARTERWRDEFAAQAQRAWRDGGEVWLSRRLLEDRPRHDSTWVEGDDPRVRWEDLPAFFSRFETDAAAGGDDGFVRVSSSPGNRRLLEVE